MAILSYPGFHTEMGFMDVPPLSHSRCLIGFDPSLEWNGYIDFLKWTTKSPKSFDHDSIDTYGDLGNHHDFRDPHMDAMDGTCITGKNHRNDSSVPTVFFNLPGSPATILYVSVCIPGVMKRGGSKWCTQWPLWSLPLSSPLWCTHRPLWVFHTVSCDQYVGGWIQGVRRRVSTVVDSVLWTSHGCPLMP